MERSGRMHTPHSGYSLLEIMIVVGLVGVLGSIAIPSALRARHKARLEQARIDVDMLSSAIRELAWDTGLWPRGAERNGDSSAETWDLTSASAGLLENDGRFADWQGPYIRDIGKDPWGQPYFFDPDYRIDGQWCIVVGSFGPNRRGRNAYDSDDIYARMK